MPLAWERLGLWILAYLIPYYFTSPIYYSKLVSIDVGYIDAYQRTDGEKMH